MTVLLLGAAGVAFAISYRETASQLSGQINHDLRSDVSQLELALRLDQDDRVASVEVSALHYLGAQPFRSSSTLLFMLIPGQDAISNFGEVFGSGAPDDRETAAQQAAENRMSAAMRKPWLGLHDQHVVDVGKVRTLERAITVGGRRVVIGAGEPLLALHRAQEGLINAFMIAAVVLVLAVLLGSYLIGHRITAPLRRMAAVAARIDAGDISSRAPAPPNEHSEVGVLAASLNHMLDRIERGVATQREFVADASHELRTPLTVIQGQLEVLAHRSQEGADRGEIDRFARMVGVELARMRRIVDDLLLLAQAERQDFLHPEPIDVGPFLHEIWDSATLVANRSFELATVPEGKLRADPDRLAQALRNLINNAIDHTATGHGTIRLEASVIEPASLRIAIVDDGPGIPPEQLVRIFNRFHRVDSLRTEGIGGSGLGLSIVRAIVEAHGGTVGATNRLDGPSGAVFELVLPGFARSYSKVVPATRR